MAFLFISAKAQLDTIPKIDGQYQYVGVVSVDSSFKKEDLYNKSKLYFVDVYNSAKDVIQYDDKDAGRIVGKGFLELNDMQWVAPWIWDVYYTTEIMVKNGKYKYRFYDIHIKQYVGTSKIETDLTIDDAMNQLHKMGYKKMTAKLLENTAKKFQNSIDVLKSYMANKENTKNDF